MLHREAVDRRLDLPLPGRELVDRRLADPHQLEVVVDRFTVKHGRPPREDERRDLVVYSRGGEG